MFPKQAGLAARQPWLPDEWAEEEGPIPLLDTASLHKRPLLTLGLAVPPLLKGSAGPWPEQHTGPRQQAACDVGRGSVLLWGGGTVTDTRVPRCGTARTRCQPQFLALDPPLLSTPPTAEHSLGLSDSPHHSLQHQQCKEPVTSPKTPLFHPTQSKALPQHRWSADTHMGFEDHQVFSTFQG